ncbi:MAG: hypothetical protein WC912_10140 [Thermovirgaceae bacterium]
MSEENVRMVENVTRREPLIGRFDHRLDPKRRFTVPARWFGRMGTPSEVYVMRSLSRERCLDVFAAADFDDRLQPFRTRALTDARLASFLRELSEAAELVTVDTQKRIRIPDDMLSYAGLQNDIVLYGTGLHFEVWALDRRPKPDGSEQARIDALADVARELNF